VVIRRRVRRRYRIRIGSSCVVIRRRVRRRYRIRIGSSCAVIRRRAERQLTDPLRDPLPAAEDPRTGRR